MADPPDTLAARPLLADAWRLAHRVHANTRRRDGAPYVDHPVEVAEIIAGAGFDERLQAVCLLHDTLEGMRGGHEVLAHRFGEDIADLVATLSEDQSIADPIERKTELRLRVQAAGSRAAAVFGADKLSNAIETTAAIEMHGLKVVEMFEITLDARIRLWEHDAAMVRRLAPGLRYLEDLDEALLKLRAAARGLAADG
ncbi:MAG: HD domain-containing protein [Solirubrobacterales bacterium]